VKHLSDRQRVLFAIPKKGRLYQQCLDLLRGCDIIFSRNNRLDIALVQNLPLALVFLPAADIPRFVGEGDVDLGITGQDQVAESAMEGDGHTREVLQLGFGKCKLQVQVPEHGSCNNPGDLLGKRVVTSFVKLSNRYFDELAKDNDASSTSASVKYVSGSVEAACALGVADGVVDLVESGETMRAAGLKAIATVMESQAVLIESPKPHSNKQLVELITARIRGVIAAKRYVLCTYNVPRSFLPRVVKITPGKRAPTITALDDTEWVAVNAMVERRSIADKMDELEAAGCSDILVTEIINSRA